MESFISSVLSVTRALIVRNSLSSVCRTSSMITVVIFVQFHNLFSSTPLTFAIQPIHDLTQYCSRSVKKHRCCSAVFLNYCAFIPRSQACSGFPRRLKTQKQVLGEKPTNSLSIITYLIKGMSVQMIKKRLK